VVIEDKRSQIAMLAGAGPLPISRMVTVESDDSGYCKKGVQELMA
jgi:hypothetical protein